ncbi:hypothetical protein HPB48_013377 [Haemaphysalis longicornis]|uniref:Uncharacterized protein n=1 Tax=Haemaphysalis longicornis TaxID=44386 RepID=A0A9J6F6L1_HAELO|nr:hypothetical protein HPB48_013377 [Haemaphysalis longicornis]
MPKVTSKQHVRKKALREVHDLLATVGSSQQDSGLISHPGRSDGSQPSLSQSTYPFLSNEQPVTGEGCVHGSPVGESDPSASLGGWGRPDDSQSLAEQELQGITDEWTDEWISVDSDDESGDFRHAGDVGDSDSQPISFASSLADWAVTHIITHKSLSSLLVLLKAHECFVELRKDARSLLKTPRMAAKRAGIVLLKPRSYCHYGLKEGLERVILNSQQCPEPISVSFNIDGLPLSKSTSTVLWPIQCLVHGCVGSCLPIRLL